MKVTYTDAGTPVIERTVEESEAHLERHVQREVGMSVAEFTKAYLAGELEDGELAANALAALTLWGDALDRARVKREAARRAEGAETPT